MYRERVASVQAGLGELAEAVASLDLIHRGSGHALPKLELIRAEGAVIRAARKLLAAAQKADVQEPVDYGKPDAFIWKDFTTGKQVVSIDRAPHGSRPLYAAPQPVSDGEITKLLSCVRYLTGIAERGMKRSIRDDESVESFVLKYVQSLEAKPSDDAKEAARYRWLREKHNDVYSDIGVYDGADILCGEIINLDLDYAIDTAMRIECNE